MADYFFIVTEVGLAIVIGLIFRYIMISSQKPQKTSSDQYKAELFPETEEAHMYKGDDRRSKARSEAIYFKFNRP